MRLNKTFFITTFVLLLSCLGLVFWLGSQRPSVMQLSDQQRIEQVEMSLPLPGPWTDDLDKMLERRLVRILVPYSKTLYFLDQGQERGIVHDAGMELQKWLNRKHGTKTLPIRVIFINTSRQHLLQDLVDGLGDIAAAFPECPDEKGPLHLPERILQQMAFI